MVKGDIILIPFPFTNLAATRVRPALILISSDIYVTVSYITTQSEFKDEACIEIQPSSNNGMNETFFVCLNKLASIDKSLVLGKIGSLEMHNIDAIDQKLRYILQIP